MAEVTLRITADTRGAVTGIEVVQRELGDLGRAGQGAAGAVSGVGEAAQRAGREAEQGMGGAAAAVAGLRTQVLGLVAGAASIGTVLSVAGIADQYGQVSARLKAVIGDTISLASAQDAVFAVAQRTRSELAATGDLVSGLARSYAAAGLSSEQAFATSLRLSEAINNALVTSGTSAAAASGLITQLGQALSSGVLRGDEFNSMMEASPRLAQALAAGLNVPIGKLREMAEAGELTRERVTAALTGIEFDKLAREAAAMPLTLAQGWQQVTNAFQQYVGRANSELGATSAVAAALGLLAENMNAVVEGALRLSVVVAAGFGINALLPVLAAFSAQLTVAGSAALGTATALTAVNVAMTGLLAGGLAFIAGWQVGTYLREQFVEVEVAGIGMVTGLMRAYERLRTATEAIGATIEIAFGNASSVARLAISDLLRAFADFAQVELPAGLRADFTFGAADGIRRLADEMEAGVRPTRSYQEAWDEIGSTLDKNLAAVDRVQTEMLDAAIETRKAGAAAVGAAADMGKLSAATGKVADEAGKAGAAMRAVGDAVGRVGVGSVGATASVGAFAGATAQAATASDELARRSQQAAEESARYWGGAGDAISNALGEGLVDGFRGTADRLKNIFKRLLADLASAAISQRIVIPIMTALGLPTGGMQTGNLLQTILGGGQPGGGGGLLSSLFGGGQGGGFLGQIGSTVGGAVRGVLGTVLGIGGGTALASGLGAVGAAGGATGLGLAGLGGGAAGAGAFAGATAGGAAGLGFMSTIGAALPVIGQIAAVAMAINALAGGRLFGTSRRPDSATQTIGLSDAGGTASATMTTVRQRSLFRGREWDTNAVDAGDEATQAARQLFEAVRQTMVTAAQQLEAEAPDMIAASLRTVQQFDKDGKVKATQYFVDILGRTWEEASAEAAATRINAEALIATIDAALGTTVAAGTQAAADAAGEVIGAAAGAIGDELRDGVTTMLKGASSALQGEASAIAERWRSDANALMDGAQLLLAAATDIRRGAGLLGDGSLTAVVGLIEDLAAEGESLAQTYARVAGSTRLLEDALSLSGITLDRTREEFVRFAADIATQAGGLERAGQLWSRYFETFFTAEERAQLAAERARAAAESQFTDIGRSVGEFTGAGGLQAFRAAFDQVLQTGSAEAIVQWLEAAEALGVLTEATARLGDAAIAQAGTLAELMASVEAALGEGAAAQGLAEQLERQRTANAEMIAQATALGASEEQLARVRALGDQRIQQIIGSVSQQTTVLSSALRRLGIAISGTSEQFAVAASGISGDFELLFEQALGSLYSETERVAMRQAVAQQNLAEAMRAAGLSTDDIISRTQLRIQLEAALAAGNFTLAESLLRVSRAMDQVDQAASNAASSTGQMINNGNGSQFGGGNNGGSGLGFGDGPTGGAAGGLVDDIERIRQGLRDWLAALTTGDLSPLRPRQQLEQAQAELQRLATAAAGGDLEALRQLSGAGDAVLRLGRSVFGSSAAYTALFEQVRALVGNAAGITTPIGGGPGGGNTRPVDDLGRSATSAAAALDLLAARAGMPAGSLSAGLPIIRPNFAATEQQVSETAARPVVQELQRGQQQQRDDADRLRAELAAMREEMAELRRASERQAQAAERSIDMMRTR